MTRVHFDDTMIHLMQFSLITPRRNITLSVFRLSQGSVATLIRSIGLNAIQNVRSLILGGLIGRTENSPKSGRTAQSHGEIDE